MGQDSPKEELRLVNAAVPIDRLVPKVLERHALQRHHEYSEEDPGKTGRQHDLDRPPDRRETEEAPVKAQDGELGRRDGEGVAVLCTQHEKPVVQEDALSLLVGEGRIEFLAEIPVDSP